MEATFKLCQIFLFFSLAKNTRSSQVKWTKCLLENDNWECWTKRRGFFLYDTMAWMNLMTSAVSAGPKRTLSLSSCQEKRGGWNIRAEMKEYRQRAPLRKIKTIKCVIVIVKKHTHTNSSRVEKGLYAAVADNAGVQPWLEFDVARVYGKYKPFRISFGMMQWGRRTQAEIYIHP
jgi:hypothetical protein